jgi:hypothetical protein
VEQEFEAMKPQAPGLNRHQLLDYTVRWRSFRRIALGVLFGALLLAAVLPASAAAPEPTVTFGASVTNGNGTLTTRLTWSTSPAAASCTASGAEDWNGAKPAAGELDLPAITLSGTYTLTLACTWPADTSARLSWEAPTQYTDGGALAKCASQADTGSCLHSFRVYHGVGASAPLDDVRLVNDRNATAYEWTGLPVGTHRFAVTAITGDGVESDKSAIGVKVIGSDVTRSSGVTLTVNPVPKAPVLTVQ